jgi:hypothetical protein
MTLHKDTFAYHQPTAWQIDQMDRCRKGFAELAVLLEEVLPPGADKTFVLRSLRTVAMWSNVCLTRGTDGEPREV